MMDAVEELIAERPHFHAWPDGKPANWAVAPDVLRFIGRQLTPGMRTLETGAGQSTVVFALAEAQHTCIIGDIRGKRAEKIEPRNQEAKKNSRRARQDGGRAHQCRCRTGGWLVRQKRKRWPNAALTDRTWATEEVPCKAFPPTPFMMLSQGISCCGYLRQRGTCTPA